MFSQNFLCKIHYLPKLSAVHGLTTKTLATPQPAKSRRNFATVPPTARIGGPQIQGGGSPKKPTMTTLGGLREFLLHPLTWDRNNGYFNILLGLAIFGYCFCTACKSEGPRTVSYEQRGKK
ncbi:uncharacterized protein LOC118742892 [Rhagoletis pomonella]|uniref:uncharacterized protein LOC118742892 n=1 Tax=Rhagoletis pomonella TaxID=28610 RepID=UPI00177C1D2D|nr:uncharacterized protein LOC118742892 [Rhagoletis pomonella]